MAELGHVLAGLRASDAAAAGETEERLATSGPPGVAGVSGAGAGASRGTLELGDRVVLGRTRKLEGSIRYYGPTAFAAGDWVGIALDAPEGKHDGTVGGLSYFRCKPGCGLFVQAAILRPGGENPTPPLAPPSAIGSRSGVGGGLSGAKRQAWPS